MGSRLEGERVRGDRNGSATDAAKSVRKGAKEAQRARRGFCAGVTRVVAAGVVAGFARWTFRVGTAGFSAAAAKSLLPVEMTGLWKGRRTHVSEARPGAPGKLRWIAGWECPVWDNGLRMWTVRFGDGGRESGSLTRIAHPFAIKPRKNGAPGCQLQWHGTCKESTYLRRLRHADFAG